MKVILVITIITIFVICTNATDNSFLPEPIPSDRNLSPKSVLCNHFKDLFDNGVYLKTACFVHQSITPDAAKHKCAEYNMNLFIMNTEVVASHLLDAAQERYPGVNGNLIVNGKRQSLSNRWQVYNIDGTVRGPLNSNIQFYSNNEPGNCLRISGKYTGIYNPLPMECTGNHLFVCEHFQRTQNPPVINTSVCQYNRNLFNYNSYLKSICIVRESLNYDQARRRCAALGMNLFMFDSAEVNEAFFEVSEDILKSVAGGWYWVNGLRNPKTNEWTLYHANRLPKGPLYDGFEFVRLNGTNGVSTGDCLRLSGQRGPFQGLGSGCEITANVICEYNRN